jgi:hypothetical protein
VNLFSIKNKEKKMKRSNKEIEKSINEFIEEISNFFNKEVIEEVARDSNFVERESKLTGHLFLAIFTFGMTIYGNPTLEELIGLLHLVMPKLKYTREALHQRIDEDAVTFFEGMLSLELKLTIPESFDLDILSDFNRVLIQDSTSWELPENLAKFFKGSGGSASASAIKIQFFYDLKTFQFLYKLQDGVSPDNKYDNSFIAHIEEGDLIIRDLGYSNSKVFAEIDLKGAYYLSRCKSDLPLYEKNDQGEFVKIDLVEKVKYINNGIGEKEVYLKKGETFVRTRLVIERVPDAVKNRRLRKINKNNKKKGRHTSKRTKILQGFNLYISNAPEKALDKKYFRILYAIRWQIELVFKNWKSNFALDKITCKKVARVKCMIYAKLLFIFISGKFIFMSKSYLWRKSKQEISEFRATKYIKTIAQEWLKLIFQNPQKINAFLRDTFDYIINHHYKIRQKDRIIPLDLIEMIENNLI